MAFKGCRYPKVTPYTVTPNVDGSETETMGTGLVFGKAATSDITINADPVKYYANDGVAESVSEFTDGTVKTEVDTLIDTTKATVLGQTIDENGVIVSSADDSPPYARYSIIVPEQINGVPKYKCVVLMRVQFQPPSETYKSKEKATTLSGLTMNGTVMKSANNVYRREKTFDTEAQALAWQSTETNMPTAHSALAVTSVPANSGTNVAVTANVVLTFNNPIDHGNATLVTASTNVPVASAKTFNGAKLILTIDPTASLTASTAYAVIITGMTDAYGQTLTDTVITFTTAA